MSPEAVQWLRAHGDKELANGSRIRDFIEKREPYADYCDDLSKDGVWGNHLTLIALANWFEVPIIIISSVEGDICHLIVDPYEPQNGRRVLYLSLLHEFHYGSL